MITLHAYILRELLKSFGLSLLALTALFTMGGGLYNVMKVEGITSGDIFAVLPLLLPVVITLTMPVAALFAATITYGRLASDNEFVAARAAGINIHRLFLSAILLSLFVTLFTLVSVNLVIPGFMKSIELYALTNIRDLAFNRLAQGGYIHHAEPDKERYTLTCQDVLNVARDQLIAKGFEPPGGGIDYFWVERPTFFMADRFGELRSFAVAEGGLVQFNTHEDEVKLTLYVKSARIYDGKRVVEPEFQKIGPFTTEIPFTPKPPMVDPQTLRRWEQAPWEFPKLGRRVAAYLEEVRRALFRDAVTESWSTGRPLTFTDPDGIAYEISAASAIAGGNRVTLGNVTVVRHSGTSSADDPLVSYTAPAGKCQVKPESDDSQMTLELQSLDSRRVVELIARPNGFSTRREKDSLRFDNLTAPADLRELLQRCTSELVMDRTAVFPADPELEGGRKQLWNQAAEVQRKIRGVVHFRASFALSALVTILMGAALGVMFRGSRALAAFGLACIPFAIVAVLISMGKQMIESEATRHVGPVLIWGGLALVAVADAVIVRCGVRR